FVADPRQLVVVHLADLLAVEEIRSFGRRIEAANQVHQRRLAGAGRPHDRHVLAALDVDRYAAEGVNLLGPHHVGLPQIARFNQSHQADFSRSSSDLTSGGASVGTCALHVRVLTGTSSSFVDVGLRCESLMAAASSPAGAIAGPIRKMMQSSRWLSLGIRDAMFHVSVSATPSTCGT